MTPFDFWTAAWRNAASMAQTGMKFGEMAQASQTVIESRSRTIQSALQNPLDGDYAELSRMVPEKVDAFSQAGLSAFTDVWSLQLEALSQWQSMASLMMSGRTPSVSRLAGMAAGSMRMATKATSASSNALAPFHKTATANARRLKKRKPA